MGREKDVSRPLPVVVLAAVEALDDVDDVESPRGWMEGKRALIAADR